MSAAAVPPPAASGPAAAPPATRPLLLALLTLAALVAFAANSILCRLALGSGAIDPGTFTTLRIASGAVVLALLVGWRREPLAGSWASAFALTLYAVPFSFAYLTLPAGTGALLLFAAVQVTMIAAGLWQGDRPGLLAWCGIAFAIGGLVWLVAQGIGAPHPAGGALMVVAGMAWGVYSLRGRGTARAIAATAGNFVRAVPLALAPGLAFLTRAHADGRGIALALGSGALASGLGYVAWYTVVPALGAIRAATVQLAVPVLAALAGVALLGEAVTWRLVLAGAAILGGVALTLRR